MLINVRPYARGPLRTCDLKRYGDQMGKIIIHNRSKFTPDAVAVRIVSEIIAQGRVIITLFC